MNVEIWRKKSLPALEIEAVRLTADNAEAVAQWCGGVLVEEINPFDTDDRFPGINVPAEFGNERASLGDYIFRTTSDEFRVRKPGAFQSIWEPKQ